MLYLVSRSPRRASLLSQYGYAFEVLEEETEEEIPRWGEKEIALKNARRKLERVRRPPKEGVLLAADTIVWVEKRILGKPESEDEARLHLGLLSGRRHSVVTGVALMNLSKGVSEYLLEETLVTLRELNKEEIDWLLLSGEALDKAGSYAIQGKAGIFVTRIEGCYMNVVGLPLPRIYPILRDWGVSPGP